MATTKDLREQNKLLKEIEERLKRITKLWEKLPKNELDSLAEATDSLASNLADAEEKWQELPNASDLDELNEAANNFSNNLTAAEKKWKELPNASDLDELVRDSGELADNLTTAKEAQDKIEK